MFAVEESAAQRRAPELSGDTESRFTLAAGTELRHYRLPYRLRLPTPARVELGARGNFLEASIKAASGGDFIVYMTSFRIRRSLSDANTLGELFTPCPLPAAPETGDFDLTVRCIVRERDTELQRSMRLTRRGVLLHYLQTSYRKDSAEQYAALERATLNPDFYVPAEAPPASDLSP
jgi:hypothetical protein